MVAMPYGIILETLKTAATYRFLDVWDFQAIFSLCHSTIYYIMTGFSCGVKHYHKIDVGNLFFLERSYVISDISKNAYSSKSAIRRKEPKPS